MKRRTVTVTSKNQITLPADLVRKYKLNQNRTLAVNEQNGAIVLNPEPSLAEDMAAIWDEMRQYVTRPLSDNELKAAAHQAKARRGDINT